jgi:hypothetical protein
MAVVFFNSDLTFIAITQSYCFKFICQTPKPLWVQGLQIHPEEPFIVVINRFKFVHFICWSIEDGFCSPLALNSDFLLKTLNVHATTVLLVVFKFLLYFQWATFLDSEGRVMDSKALKKRIFYGGVEHTTRREVCCLLSLNNCFMRHSLV